MNLRGKVAHHYISIESIDSHNLSIKRSTAFITIRTSVVPGFSQVVNINYNASTMPVLVKTVTGEYHHVVLEKNIVQRRKNVCIIKKGRIFKNTVILTSNSKYNNSIQSQNFP